MSNFGLFFPSCGLAKNAGQRDKVRSFKYAIPCDVTVIDDGAPSPYSLIPTTVTLYVPGKRPEMVVLPYIVLVVEL